MEGYAICQQSKRMIMNPPARDYVLTPIQEDEEFVLSRRTEPGCTNAPSVLLLSPISKQPSREILRKLENEYLAQGRTELGMGGSTFGPVPRE